MIRPTKYNVLTTYKNLCIFLRTPVSLSVWFDEVKAITEDRTKIYYFNFIR